jgi:hypothetical protein
MYDACVEISIATVMLLRHDGLHGITFMTVCDHYFPFLSYLACNLLLKSNDECSTVDNIYLDLFNLPYITESGLEEGLSSS